MQSNIFIAELTVHNFSLVTITYSFQKYLRD